jgi:hypothetical protein
MSADKEKTPAAMPIEPDVPVPEPSNFPMPTKTIWDPIGKVSSGHAEAFWAPKPKSVTPYEDLIPEVSDDAGRRAHVGAHVARGVLAQSNFRSPDDEYRPQTLSENIMAFRAGDKKLKADPRSMEANKIADPYLEPDPDNPGQSRVNFRKGYDALSTREKRVVRKDEKRYNKLQRQAGRLMTGMAIPLIGRRVGGFQQAVGTRETPRDRS